MAENEQTATGKAAHHGRNVKRFREMWGLKQDGLAGRLGQEWSQKRVSQLEAMDTIDTELLAEIGKALNVSVDVLKNFSEDTASNFFSDFHESAASATGPAVGTVTPTDSATATGVVNNYNCTFNALDKYVEAVDKIEKLYETLLKTEREKIAVLERLLDKK